MSRHDEGLEALTHLPHSPLIIALINFCVFHVSITVSYLCVSLLAENEDTMNANLLLLSTCKYVTHTRRKQSENSAVR